MDVCRLTSSPPICSFNVLTPVPGVDRYEGHVGAVQLVVEELLRQVADVFGLDVHRRLLMSDRHGTFGVFRRPI